MLLRKVFVLECVCEDLDHLDRMKRNDCLKRNFNIYELHAKLEIKAYSSTHVWVPAQTLLTIWKELHVSQIASSVILNDKARKEMSNSNRTAYMAIG